MVSISGNMLRHIPYGATFEMSLSDLAQRRTTTRSRSRAHKGSQKASRIAPRHFSTRTLSLKEFICLVSTCKCCRVVRECPDKVRPVEVYYLMRLASYIPIGQSRYGRSKAGPTRNCKGNYVLASGYSRAGL